MPDIGGVAVKHDLAAAGDIEPGDLANAGGDAFDRAFNDVVFDGLLERVIYHGPREKRALGVARHGLHR